MPLAKERSSGWSSASTRVSQSSRASRPWTAGHHLGEAADVPAQGVQVRAAGLNGGEPCLVTGVKAVSPTEAVRFLIKVSPACVIPEMMFVRPGDAL